MKNKGYKVLGLLAGFFTLVFNFSTLSFGAKPDSGMGRVIYEENCIPCHGARGRGDGVTGKFLKPPPSNLTSPESRGKARKETMKVVKNGK
ncbi:MAG TPA: c-type cytochrome [Nitrospiria bacterium]